MIAAHTSYATKYGNYLLILPPSGVCVLFEALQPVCIKYAAQNENLVTDVVLSFT